MTPERLKFLNDTGSKEIRELALEIERLQAPLPEDLEKRLGEIEYELGCSSLYGTISHQIMYKRDVPWLTTTIRALQAELRNERKLLLTAVRILLEGKSRAATNAVREDYPEFAELIDRERTPATERIAELEFALEANRTSMELETIKLFAAERDLTAMQTLAGEFEKLVRVHAIESYDKREVVFNDIGFYGKPSAIEMGRVLLARAKELGVSYESI